jgi:hypothetical protein
MPEQYKFNSFNNNLKNLSVVACRMSYNGLLSLKGLKLRYLKASYNTFYKTSKERGSEKD